MIQYCQQPLLHFFLGRCKEYKQDYDKAAHHYEAALRYRNNMVWNDVYRFLVTHYLATNEVKVLKYLKLLIDHVAADRNAHRNLFSLPTLKHLINICQSRNLDSKYCQFLMILLRGFWTTSTNKSW